MNLIALITDNLFAIYVVLFLGYLLETYIKWSLNYWPIKGVPVLTSYLEPFKVVILQKRPFVSFWEDAFEKTKKLGLKHSGINFVGKRFYMPTDLNVIKNILTTDFQHFSDHGFYVNERDDPLTGHLFNLYGQKWKNLREKLSPTFTSGKMKLMFQTLLDCSTGLDKILEKSSSSKTPIDIKTLMRRFTIDVIGSCAFGIECNCLENPDSKFLKYGQMVNELTLHHLLKQLLQFMLPFKLMVFLRLKVFNPVITNFYQNIVKSTVEYREKNNIYRKDFMHLLLQLKNRGEISDDVKSPNKETSDDVISPKPESPNQEVGLTLDQLTAQCFAFFIAGFGTTSTAITYALYEIAQNKEIQEKMRNEILKVKENNEGKLSYDAINDLTYMSQVINETLRKHSPVPVIIRRCTKQYKIPTPDELSVVIDKGDMVIVPIKNIHYDPEIYPCPNEFDPERFSEENKASRPSCTWLPFGEGPRHCIGKRFGLMQIKVGLCSILENYDISLNSKTGSPLVVDNQSFILSCKNEMYIDIVKRDCKNYKKNKI